MKRGYVLKEKSKERNKQRSKEYWKIDPQKKKIRIRHESDASQNATTFTFTAKVMIKCNLFKML